MIRAVLLVLATAALFAGVEYRRRAVGAQAYSRQPFYAAITVALGAVAVATAVFALVAVVGVAL